MRPDSFRLVHIFKGVKHWDDTVCLVRHIALSVVHEFTADVSFGPFAVVLVDTIGRKCQVDRLLSRQTPPSARHDPLEVGVTRRPLWEGGIAFR